MLDPLCCLLQWRGSSVLRLHVLCAVVVEVVLKLKLVVHVANSQLYLRNWISAQFSGSATKQSSYIEDLLQIDSAHGCGVCGVLPLQPATYVVFSLDCVDTYSMYYTLYCTVLYYTLRIHYVCIRSVYYSTILYYTILYYTILYYTILYYTILYYTTLHCLYTVYTLVCSLYVLEEEDCSCLHSHPHKELQI